MEELINKIVTVLVGENPALAEWLALIAPLALIALEWFKNRAVSDAKTRSEDVNRVLKECEEVKKNAESTTQAISIMANMMITSLLSQKTISQESKNLIAQYGTQLQHLAGLDIKSATSSMLDAIVQFIPDAEEKREEIMSVAEKVENALDEANEKATSVIDQLKLE